MVLPKKWIQYIDKTWEVMTFCSKDDVLGAGNKLGLVADAREGGSVLFVDSPYSLLTVNFSEYFFLRHS
jgi:hypothetical protein